MEFCRCLNPSCLKKLIASLIQITLWSSWMLDKEILPVNCCFENVIRSRRLFIYCCVHNCKRVKFHFKWSKWKSQTKTHFFMRNRELVIANVMQQGFFAVLENTPLPPLLVCDKLDLYFIDLYFNDSLCYFIFLISVDNHSHKIGATSAVWPQIFFCKNLKRTHFLNC